uniref:Uncharacterized protein n=1 Tax=Aplanochytrium stocchinoi TaxID=215587 RepID=A0A7S3V334_9STRA|mmetsp:Transcript_11963/g.14875  ORF Transcript_11963/g.14875 Transcript_11963/m.14875 type:complete len:169 (-) Transcript_11963:418-924(-)
MGRLKEKAVNFIEGKGVSLDKVPTVIATFTVAKYFVWVGFLVLGMRFQPVRKTFQRPTPKRWKENFQKKYPDFYNRNQERVLTAANKVANSNWFKPIADRFSTNRAHAAIGLAEGMLCYKIFFPIHAPLTLWVVATAYATKENKENTKGYLEQYRSLRSVSDVEGALT